MEPHVLVRPCFSPRGMVAFVCHRGEGTVGVLRHSVPAVVPSKASLHPRRSELCSTLALGMKPQ